MNKKKVDSYLKNAVAVLEKTKIVEEKKIEKGYRRQISTFGASVTMGSILSAVACFSEQGKANVNRSKLMAAIYLLLKNEKLKEYNEELKEYYGKKDPDKKDPDKNYSNKLFEYVKDNYPDNAVTVKEEILEAAVALKLAMNLYELKK